jgi:hypothetical protein
MTALEMRQDAEAEFARDARHNREALAVALAQLTLRANIALELSLSHEYRAQFGESTRALSMASVQASNTARRELREAIEAVTRVCGVRL